MATDSDQTGDEQQRNAKGPTKLPWRKNVLAVLLLAYTAIMVLFFGMILGGVDAKMSFDLISVPFVALIGGTLAVAKDLLE